MKDKKVIFMGTPEFSVPILESLISITNVVLVITKVDSEVGRKKVLTPSPIKEVALKNDIEVLTPVKISDAISSNIPQNLYILFPFFVPFLFLAMFFTSL